VDPTDEEDEEPDLNEPEATSSHAKAEGHHHIIDDGSLDKLPDDGNLYTGFYIFKP
jgi:hypothetical protein